MNTTFIHRSIRELYLCLCLLFATIAAQAAQIRQGTLPNGLRYYICVDKGTPNYTHYYLYQNVGAVLETEQQQGLAHVLEHLAFNTTQHFPEGAMTFLRNHQLFDFEAFTGTDETRFAVHNVPSADTKLNQQMLFLLHDWCHGLTFTEKDLEKERGIVLEEWRERYGVNQRLSESIAPAVYNHSIYAQRNVIGTEAGLKKFKLKDVRKFYDTWYRPNRQFVAVIGDFDADTMEAELRKALETLPKQTAPTEGNLRQIKPNTEPNFARFVDAQNSTPSFGIYQRYDTPASTQTENSTRNFLFTRLFNQLAPRRFAWLRNNNEEKFIAASVSLSPLVRNQSQMAWDVVPYVGKESEALAQILDIRNSLANFGVGTKEFDEAKLSLYNGMKSLLEADGLGTPDNYFDLFKLNFLYGDTIVPFRDQIENNLETLVELDASDMNTWLATLLDQNNLTFATFVQKDNEIPLSLTDFTTALRSPQSVAIASVNPPEKLIDFDLPTGNIVTEKQLTKSGAKEWTLSNGARVLYKFVPTEAGSSAKFYFAGAAQGGVAAVDPKDLPSYTAMKDLIMQTGLYKYSRNQLYDWVKDKDFELTITPDQYSDGVGGSAAPEVADDFFAYLYLVLNKQRFSSSVFDKYIQRQQYLARTQQPTGMAAIQDSIQTLLTPPSPNNPKTDANFYAAANFEQLAPLFEQHFGRAEQFTFCIVGDLPEQRAKQLVVRYLAALSGDAKRAEQPTQHSLDFVSKAPSIVREFTTELDGDRSEVELAYVADIAVSEQDKAALEVFRTMLEHRYFNELREKAQATYSIGVRAESNEIVDPQNHDDVERISLNIHFSTSRQRADEMRDRAKSILAAMADGDFSTDEFKAAQVPLAVNAAAEEATQAENDPTDLLWMQLLNLYAETGEISEQAAEAISTPQTAIKGKQAPKLKPEDSSFGKLTPELVKQFASKLLRVARYREFVVKSLPPHERNWEK